MNMFGSTRVSRRKAVTLGAAAIAALTLAAPGAQAQQKYTMKFGTQTLNDIQHEYMKIFKGQIEELSKGQIVVEIYPASQLGPINRMVEGLRLGTIEALIGPAELYAGIDPRYQVMAMTGLWKDREHARKALDLPAVRDLISSIGTQRGIVTIGLTVYAPQGFNTKQPINTLADFSGRRIRVLASEAEQASVRSLGAAPVPMSLPEVLPAMQQGTIDGLTSVLGVFASLRYYDAAPYVLDTKLWSLIPIALVNKNWFEKLPPDLQKAVMEAGKRSEPINHEWQTAKIKSDTEAWTKANGKFNALSPADQAEAQKRVLAAIDPVLAKDAPMKEFYGKLKALTASVE